MLEGIYNRKRRSDMYLRLSQTILRSAPLGSNYGYQLVLREPFEKEVVLEYTNEAPLKVASPAGYITDLFMNFSATDHWEIKVTNRILSFSDSEGSGVTYRKGRRAFCHDLDQSLQECLLHDIGGLSIEGSEIGNKYNSLSSFINEIWADTEMLLRSLVISVEANKHRQHQLQHEDRQLLVDLFEAAMKPADWLVSQVIDPLGISTQTKQDLLSEKTQALVRAVNVFRNFNYGAGKEHSVIDAILNAGQTYAFYHDLNVPDSKISKTDWIEAPLCQQLQVHVRSNIGGFFSGLTGAETQHNAEQEHQSTRADEWKQRGYPWRADRIDPVMWNRMFPQLLSTFGGMDKRVDIQSKASRSLPSHADFYHRLGHLEFVVTFTQI